MIPRFSASSRMRDLVDRDTLQWLLVAQGVTVLPLFFYLPLWLPVMWAAVVLARIQMFRGAWPFPNGYVKTFIGLLAIAGLVISYRGGVGVEPMVAFLVVAFVLKLLEVRDTTGVLLVVYIGFIGVAALFIFSQAMWAALYALFTLTLLFGCLQSMFRSRSTSLIVQIKQAFVLLLKSVPVMGILFLVIPRISPLWAVPDPGVAGKTGFSDTMSPGDFSDLVQSQEIAFRVTFEPDPDTQKVRIPPQNKLYWRGLALDTFDGRQWRFTQPWDRFGATVRPSNAPHPNWGLRKTDKTLDTYRYSILLEPHRRPWLFTMLVPFSAQAPIKLGFTDDFLLMAAKDIRHRMLYHVESTTGYLRMLRLDRREKAANLKIPDGNEKAQALAKSWVSESLSPQERVNKALQFYNQSFSYSLKAPLLGKNTVDDFLFRTRVGFCEHFASSFVFLMRAADVPARVVVGYQGGTFSEDASHLVVRQSDAHAWAEVWFPGEGWVRVDPTSVIAPDRIRSGITEALNSQDINLISGGLWGRAWVKSVIVRWEELEYLWQRNILSYDSSRQNSLLSKLLGENTPWRIALFLIGGIGILLFIYFFLPQLFSLKRRESTEIKLYKQYIKKMAKKGVEYYSWEPAEGYAERVAQLQPSLAARAKVIARLYNQIAFGKKTTLIPQLKSAIDQI